ncbi:JAB domain-containing protein [Limnohabitans sp.]|jgi:DNA repair protein RadC|uniref:JAB domain-containing protein n=1 Tax=Limnohabitans sp. TaxID=1907725 RepID=UPI0037C150D8
MANYAEHPIIRQALELLACEIQQTDTLQSPDAVKDYLRLKLGDRPHEVFAVVFMDSQNRVGCTSQGHWAFSGK